MSSPHCPALFIIHYMFSHSIASDSFVIQWTAAARLLCPWDFPGKNTRVGCHFFPNNIVYLYFKNFWRKVVYLFCFLFANISCPSLGEGHADPLQYSCLENPVDRGAWWAAAHGVAQSQPQLKRLSLHACTGEGNGNPPQCSCLENPRDGGAWWAAVYGVAQNQTWLKQPSSSSSSMSFFIYCKQSRRDTINMLINSNHVSDKWKNLYSTKTCLEHSKHLLTLSNKDYANIS